MKICRGGSSIKTTTLVFTVIVVIAFLESAAIVFVNERWYANIIEMTWYTTIPFFCLFVGWVGISRGRTKRVFWVILCLVVISPIVFLVTLPHATYQEGEQLVSYHLGKPTVTFVSVRHKSVLVNKRYASFLLPEFYYYEVSSKETGVHDYFTVNPVTEKVMHLKTPFYGG